MRAIAAILGSILVACVPQSGSSPPDSPQGTPPPTGEPAPIGPTDPDPQPEPTTRTPMPTHTLDLRTPVPLDRENTLRVEDLVIEEIEASPDGNYPSGSGVDVVVIFQRGSYEIKRPLTLLSEGYDSRPTTWFEGYRVTLLDVADPHGTAKVSLLVERVTDRPDGAPVKHRVKKGGEVQIDPDTRLRFVGHGHKRTMPGQSSPLMVAVDWLVRGTEDEGQSLNVGADPATMGWAWRKWQISIDEYDYDQWMQLTVQAWALERVESR